MSKDIASDVADDIALPSYFSDHSARRGKRVHWRISAAVLLFVSFLWWSWSHRLIAPCTRPALSSETVATVPESEVPNIGFPRTTLRTWGQYSPYVPVAKYMRPPPGCVIDQVNVLQRHGSRWPTTQRAAEYKVTVEKLQGVKDYKEKYLVFLKNFTWNFGAEDLLPLGATQSFEAGAAAFRRYRDIVTEDNPPFVRAAGSPRVVDSAANWTAGFRAASRDTIKARVDLVLPETGNLTLDDGMCPNADDGDKQTKKWRKVYAPPIKKRLNAAAPGAHLNNKDVHNLMSLCVFHSQVTMSPSPFCALFNMKEFIEYEYHADLDKFYSNGYGGKLGRVQGVGYVNELIARLSGQPVRDNTQTNRTLDASPETFPLDRILYADFSHDNAMVAIYSALGLFQQRFLPKQELDPINPSALRTWVVSTMVPFSARMVVERFECTRARPLPNSHFVRILVNDAVQPLEFCGGNAGLCELDAFLDSQGYAKHDGEGDFEKCFA